MEMVEHLTGISLSRSAAVLLSPGAVHWVLDEDESVRAISDSQDRIM
jgi:hypothetical protein